jgi:hypothetical protein
MPLKSPGWCDSFPREGVGRGFVDYACVLNPLLTGLRVSAALLNPIKKIRTPSGKVEYDVLLKDVFKIYAEASCYMK